MKSTMLMDIAESTILNIIEPIESSEHVGTLRHLLFLYLFSDI